MSGIQALTIVLAGGEGKRLHPLTRSRAKPAVPFGGHYRLVDFVLSNLTNARFMRIVVLTQYKSHSLDRHVAQTWRLAPTLGEYVVPVPAQMRNGPHWFSGSADAIFQNLNILDDENPAYVLVFGADHVYRMDPRQMLDANIASGAGVTLAGIRVPIEQADQFGIIEADASGRITAFREKPSDPAPLADDPSSVFASMGNYVFTASLLRQVVTEDAADDESTHDVGGSIVPRLVEQGEAQVYDFTRNLVPGRLDRELGYWRDVGTIDAFHEAHMDLVSIEPVFDLYNPEWPINSWKATRPPAKHVVPYPGARNEVSDSIICDGTILSGSVVRRSVISPDVWLRENSHVEDSVLMDGVLVESGSVVRRAIIDKNVVVPANFRVGVDTDWDRQRFTVTESGLVVIGKNDVLE
ncbi:MAG: glucose-1-phosphate adenylyltransferase [Tepidiformaceae bacterium]